MSDAPNSYFALSRSQRDFLIAVAHHAESPPNGITAATRVQELRGGTPPTNNTTYRALSDLVDMGLLEKRAVDEKESAYHVTADGNRLLEAAADQLYLATDE